MAYQIIEDFPSGPLDYYRKKASFDWKLMKIFIYTEDVVKYEKEILDILESHPKFQKNVSTLSLDEERRKCMQQFFASEDLSKLNYTYTFPNFKKANVSSRVLMQLEPSTIIKYGIATGMFVNVLLSLGSEKHADLVEAAQNRSIIGCFALTEIAHGSNTKGMRTRATYDKENKQFIFNTPDFEAAKCWAGSLGQCATHAIVYAQLYVNEVHHGLHAFVVPIRDVHTRLPFPGVIVGDMGEKIGLNGIDNGFLLFKNYAVPKENLLNKTGDIDENGNYVTKIKSSSERYGASFGALSSGRVNITTFCEAYGIKALTIAIRYAAVRKQFGPENQPELPVLEYQSQQHRLLPYLAASYVYRIFSEFLVENNYQFLLDSLTGENKSISGELGMEIHGVSSASKPVAGWIFRDAIQESRECCGGHGYLKASGLGDIRNENDANLTYEGENHVLIQQTSNWLLKYWPQIVKKVKITSPLGSLDLLSDFDNILKTNFSANNIEEICNPREIMNVYRWLVCYYLKATKEKYDKELAKSNDPFHAKNEVQVYYAKNLGIVFVTHFALLKFLNFIEQVSDDACKKVLLKLYALFGLWYMEKFIPTLYEGEYAQGPKFTTLVHDAVLYLCREIKDDAVSLVDAVAPPDFIVNSVLGSSDGQVYKRLESAMLRSPYSMSRPSWWQEMVLWNKNKL